MELAVLLLTLLTLATVGLALMSRRTAARAEGQVADLERQDLLTGLVKRPAFMEALETELAKPPTGSNRAAVLVVELNRFAAINETYGHEVGDALLRAVAQRLSEGLGPDEVLCRYGGPQFALLSPSMRGIDHVQRRAAELLALLDQPVRMRNDNIRVSASIGFVLVDQRPGTADEVTEDAMTALRQAVTEGPNRIVPFELSLRSHLSPATAERQLRQAFEREEFWLFYLPVVELGTNHIVGVEALLRWADPDHGLSAPDRFLTSLDDTGLIVPVGIWVVEQAVAQAVTWRGQFPDLDLTMTVNVSPRQLMDPEFVDALRRTVSTSELEPEHLVVEIAAGTDSYDVEGVWSSLRAIKSMGIQIALDDFGVGHASLDYIRRFQIDVLKIERSFVQRLDESREDLAIVQQLIGMSQALGLTTIAEGVDSAEEAQTLLGLDCHFAQGYYWTKPQPPDVIERMLGRGRVLPGETAKVDWTG